MNSKFLLFIITVLSQLQCFSQNGSLATSYTMDACGLNFTQASVRLNQRVFNMSPGVGSVQPASLTIAGIPYCANVLKAFLYVGVSGNGSPITATVSNPVAATSAFPMSVIGTDIDVCWGFQGTYSYRADVTSIINGNGTYILSGIPTSVNSNTNSVDADGATLFVIYQDIFQNYTGSIVLADGCHAITPNTPAYANNTITGFSVCGTPTLTQNFLIVADLQQLGNTVMNLNTVTNNSLAPNFNQSASSDKVWDFITAPSPIGMATSGQTSANYGLYSSVGDCLAWIMTGMYYRTNCLTCVASPVNTVVSLSISSTPSCVSSATVFATGGTPPYTYNWLGTSLTSSVISNIGTGIYVVAVSGFGGCGSDTISIEIPNQMPTPSATSPTVCVGSVSTLYASGGASFLWEGPFGFTSSASSVTVAAANTPTTAVYTITVTSASSCTGVTTAVLTTTSNPTVQISASSTIICKGGSTTLTPVGAQSYTWLATSLSQTQAIVVTPTASTIYSLQGASAHGCKDAATILVNVSECTGITEEEIHNPTLRVYPNPTSGSFIISAKEKMTLQLINTLGQQISTIELHDKNDYKHSVLNLASGIYYLKAEGSLSFKLVVEK